MHFNESVNVNAVFVCVSVCPWSCLSVCARLFRIILHVSGAYSYSYRLFTTRVVETFSIFLIYTHAVVTACLHVEL